MTCARQQDLDDEAIESHRERNVLTRFVAGGVPAGAVAVTVGDVSVVCVRGVGEAREEVTEAEAAARCGKQLRQRLKT